MPHPFHRRSSVKHPPVSAKNSAGRFADEQLNAKFLSIGREVPFEVRRGVSASLFLLCTPLVQASGVLCFWEVSCDVLVVGEIVADVGLFVPKMTPR